MELKRNMTPNNELKLLYKIIAEQTEIAKQKYQQVLMVEDFKQYQKEKDSLKE